MNQDKEGDRGRQKESEKERAGKTFPHCQINDVDVNDLWLCIKKLIAVANLIAGISRQAANQVDQFGIC